MPWTNFGQECEVLPGRILTIYEYFILCFCFAPRVEINTIHINCIPGVQDKIRLTLFELTAERATSVLS